MPLSFMWDTSVVFPDEDNTHTHYKAVRARVEWDYIPSDDIKYAEDGEDKKITMDAFILPEVEESKDFPQPECSFNNASIHPFWHIRRSCITGTGNCEIVNVSLEPTIASDFVSLDGAGTNLRPARERLDVELPCIVNTKTIQAQEEVVLALVPPPTETKKRKVDAIQ